MVIDSQAASGVVGPTTSQRSLAIGRLLRDRAAVLAMVVLGLIILGAIVGAPLASFLTGHGPRAQFDNAIGPTGKPVGIWSHAFGPDGVTPNPHGQFFVLGADGLGRDMLVRILYGARIALAIAFGATTVAVIVGVVVGLLAGWYGGVIDAVVSRMIEFSIAFPALLLAIALAVVIGPGLLNVMFVIAAFTWYYPARIVRGAILRLRNAEFVEAAVMVGVSTPRLFRRHLLPQLVAPLTVYASTVVASNMLFEAGLSYLGLGVPPPAPSWGQMLSEAVTSGRYRTAPLLALIPGIALCVTLLAFNLLGDGVRDAVEGRGE